MPARSEAQRKMFSIAEHHPEKLYKRNRQVREMSKSKLSDFASTKEKGLPRYAHSRGMGGAGHSPCKMMKREGGMHDGM